MPDANLANLPSIVSSISIDRFDSIRSILSSRAIRSAPIREPDLSAPDLRHMVFVACDRDGMGWIIL
jgi:hypothetical protein